MPSSLSLEQFGVGSPRGLGLTNACTSAASPLGVLLQSGQPRRSVLAPEPGAKPLTTGAQAPSGWPTDAVHSPKPSPKTSSPLSIYIIAAKMHPAATQAEGTRKRMHQQIRLWDKFCSKHSEQTKRFSIEAQWVLTY